MTFVKRCMRYASIMWALWMEDLELFKDCVLDRFIDAVIIVVGNLIVMGYILPAMGLPGDFGIFMIAGLMVSAALFEDYAPVSDLVADITGPRKISFLLTLPIPTWLLGITRIWCKTFRYTVMSFFVFPPAKLLLWNSLSLASISWMTLIGIIVLNCVLVSVFGFLITSFIRNMADLGQVWVRFLFPLWILGGFQFSWFMIYKALPYLSYLLLLNPFMYATEGVRSTMLDSSQYLNIWFCALAMILTTIGCGYVAYIRLKQRLDWV